MRRRYAMALGTALLAAGMLGASLTVAASDTGVEAQELDAAMPGSEQMMEQCVNAMGEMTRDMDGMPVASEDQ